MSTATYPRCGVASTVGRVRSTSSAGSGSRSNTSRPAPAIRPCRRASTSAGPSTIAERDVLTRNAEGRIRASSSRPSRPRVRSPSARWIETTSLVASSSARLGASVTPSSSVRSRVRCRLQATTSMSKAEPIRATRPPIRPSPSSPSRRPASSMPTVLCQRPPAWNAAFSAARLRARPRIRAQVSSVGGTGELAVPQTSTPWAAAAGRSMAELRIPVVTTSRSRGRRANTGAGSGVRSRITTTMSTSASAATSSAGSAWCSVNAVTSTRSVTGDQSAMDSATPWWSSSTAQHSRVVTRRPCRIGQRSRCQRVCRSTGRKPARSAPRRLWSENTPTCQRLGSACNRTATCRAQ